MYDSLSNNTVSTFPPFSLPFFPPLFLIYSRYGVLIFTMVMAVRQMLSIIISAYRFNHHISPLAWVGIGIVFAAISFRIYMRQRSKKNPVRKSTKGSTPTKP